MPHPFHDGQRQLQDHFDTRRLADTLQERNNRPALNANQKAFIESANMFFLATADADGFPTCSYKGGDPGDQGGCFVRCVDDHTLAIPNYDGDGKFLSWGNAIKNPHVALLFIDFERAWRLRVQGDATLHLDDPLLPSFPEAQFVVRVAVKEAFGNCPRYIHRYQLVERSPFVPHCDRTTPVPEWKKKTDIKSVLPARDRSGDAHD